MDPQTPSPNYGQPQMTPPSFQQPEIPPKKSWFTPKKIGLVIAVLVVAAVIATALLGGNKQNKNAQDNEIDTSNPAIYNKREGYNPDSYLPKIGDPLALKMSATAKPFGLGGGGFVIPACAVLTLDDLKAQKLYIGTNSTPTTVIRTYFDGVGTAPLQPEAYTLPGGGEGNECSYLPETSDSIIVIDVYQPPLITVSNIQNEINRRYTSQDSVDGMQVYKRTGDREGESSYIMRKGDTAVSLMLRLGKGNDSKVQSFLAAAAKNVNALQASPKGAAIAEYDTPTFKKKIAMACNLMSDGDIKQLTGNPASQYVEEHLATATGVDKINGKLYNFIQNECSRSNSGLGSGIGPGAFDQKLDITTTTYQDDIAAKAQMQSAAADNPNKVTAALGDEGFGYKDTAGQNTVLFRQGRFVVMLVFNRTVQRDGLQDTATMTQKLTPFAQQAATKLKQLQ